MGTIGTNIVRTFAVGHDGLASFRRLHRNAHSGGAVSSLLTPWHSKRTWFLAITVVSALTTATYALEGTATYTPAESNLAIKYWVKGSAKSGDAAAALDGKPDTIWTPIEGQAELLVDLGGTYDAVHKVRLRFADHAHVRRYRLHGSADGQTWRALADRANNATRGGLFTDLFSSPGLRYLRLELVGDPAGGVRDIEIINYLRADLQNGSDTSEQGGSTTAYYYNAGNNPPVPGVRGGRFSDPGSIESGNNFFGLTKDLGWDVIRLRIWNEPRSENNGNPGNSPGNCSPANTLRVAKAVVGAGQTLGIDFHYSDIWSDPQNQPKPYAWSDLPFEQLQQATHDFTHEVIENLVKQGTAPGIVAIGNEVTNGMMWGSEYDLITPYVDRHHYYTSGRYKGHPGGGVKWLKYEEAHGNTESPAYREFLDSVRNLALLIDAGNRAVKKVNAAHGTNIKTQLHFAFNVFERANGQMVALNTQDVFKRVMALVGTLNKELSARSGMVDGIGISYYPDWHGSYDTLQRNLIEISRALPNVTVTIAECSPSFRGTVAQAIQNLNHPVGFAYSTQSQGDDTIDLMKTINDVPNNAGTGVWPWAGTQVYATGRGEEGTLRASFKAWNDGFAKNVLEDRVFVGATSGQTPKLPTTVRSLDLATGQVSDVAVQWEPLPDKIETATYTVRGEAQVQTPEKGRGKVMTQVNATVHVAEKLEIADPAIEDRFAKHLQSKPSQGQAEAKSPVVIIEDGGTGPYPAVVTEAGTLPGMTIFRPRDLSPFGADQKLPILLWGNGACANTAEEHKNFLNEIASHGYLILAIGLLDQIEVRDATSRQMTRSSQLLTALDWILAENASSESIYLGKIDASKVAAMGMSCGGLQAIEISGDPRISTTVVCNSGVLPKPSPMAAMPSLTKEALKSFHAPVLYIMGGPSDIAYKNAMDDFSRVSHVPIVMTNLDVGHAGTYTRPHGGEFTRVALAWLDWQLKDRTEACRMFLGEDSELSRDAKWTVETKNFD